MALEVYYDPATRMNRVREISDPPKISDAPLREIALGHAIHLTMQGHIYPADTLETAAKYLAFLKGQ